MFKSYSMNEFLKFHDVQNSKTPCIPWSYIWSLHDSKHVWLDCLLQIICILNFVQKAFGNETYFYNFDIQYIFLTNSSHPKHVFVYLGNHTTYYTIRHHYTVRFDWKNILKPKCFFPKQYYRRSIFMNLFSNNPEWLKIDERIHVLYKKLIKQRTSPSIEIPLWGEELTPILWNMISTKHLYETKPNYKSIKELFMIIQTEIDKFTSQFKNKMNANTILFEWVEILSHHQEEFFVFLKENDATLKPFINRLKTYLYQTLVENQYQHIQLKEIDFQKLIISMYLWTMEYIQFLHSSLPTKDNTDDIFLMVFELFFNSDEMEKDDDIIVFTNRPMVLKATAQLIRTHPILRSNVLKQII